MAAALGLTSKQRGSGGKEGQERSAELMGPGLAQASPPLTIPEKPVSARAEVPSETRQSLTDLPWSPLTSVFPWGAKATE